MIFPGTQGGPLMHVIAAKAVAFLEALQPEFKAYQQQVVANARAHGGGAAASAAISIVSGGTDNHLFLLDLIDKERTPARTPTPRSAARTSRSTRTPCRTIRGRRSSPAACASARRRSRRAASAREESRQVAGWIADVLDARRATRRVVRRVREARCSSSAGAFRSTA